MDIVLMFLALCGIVISLVSCIISLTDKSMLILAFICISLTASTIYWISSANESRWKDPQNTIVSYYPIQIVHDKPYYIDKDNNLKFLGNDLKYVDVNKFQIKHTLKIGGWTSCMYVTSNDYITATPITIEKP